MFLSEAMDGRRNNFDHLRLLAALTVVVSHTFPISGAKEPSFFLLNNTLGGIGVAVFLMISGFLVTNSWFRTKSHLKFFKARCLRILPALFVVVLLVVFVLGPIVTQLPVNQYFKSGGTYKYLISLTVMFPVFHLPGVFLTNPYAAMVNAPIWTLRYEFSFYILLAAAGVTGLLKKKIIPLLLFALTLELTWNNPDPRFVHLVFLSCYFLAGMVFYLYRDVIPLKGGYALICLAVFVLSLFIKPLDGPLFVIFGSYLIFYLALAPGLRLPSLAKIGDLSYGLYIFAFPVQQTVVWLYGGKISTIRLFAVSFPFILTLALLSWHLVEKHALNLKNRSLRSLFAPKIHIVRSKP